MGPNAEHVCRLSTHYVRDDATRPLTLLKSLDGSEGRAGGGGFRKQTVGRTSRNKKQINVLQALRTAYVLILVSKQGIWM